MADRYEQSMMDNLYWWGVPTLFRCPHVGPQDQDIALVGVPHSAGNGTTERDQHLGPRAAASTSPRVQRRAHGGFQLDPWSKLRKSLMWVTCRFRGPTTMKIVSRAYHRVLP